MKYHLKYIRNICIDLPTVQHLGCFPLFTIMNNCILAYVALYTKIGS